MKKLLQKNIDNLNALKTCDRSAYLALYNITLKNFNLSKRKLDSLLQYEHRFSKLLNANPKSPEKQKLFKQFCITYDLSTATLYRYLKSKSLKKQNKKRADAGYSKKTYNFIKKSSVTKQKNKMNKDFKKFLSDFFQLENPPADELKLKINKLSFVITKDDAADIILVLTNAYNRWQKHNELDLPLDRDLLREQMLMHLFESQMRIAAETGDIKSIETLTRIYDRMKPQSDLDTDFAVFEKCMRELKPGITKEEVISLIKKNSDEKN